MSYQCHFLTNLNLADVRIDEHASELLAEFLQSKFCRLGSLNLDKSLNSYTSLLYIIQGIQDNQTLLCVSLQQEEPLAHVEILQTFSIALQSTLEMHSSIVNFRLSPIESSSLFSIAKALEKNELSRTLKLSGNCVIPLSLLSQIIFSCENLILLCDQILQDSSEVVRCDSPPHLLKSLSLTCTNGITVELLDQIVQICGRTITSLNLYQKIVLAAPVQHKILQSLCVNISSLTIRDVDMCNCQLSQMPYLNYIFQAMGKIPCLEKVNLSNNSLTDQHLSQLVTFFSNSKSLKVLELQQNQFTGKGMVYLAKIVENGDVPLEQINLSGNRIGEIGMTRLSQAVKYHKTLNKLLLNGCDLQDGGIYSAATAACSIPNLEEISFEGDDIMYSGAMGLSNLIESHKNLT